MSLGLFVPFWFCWNMGNMGNMGFGFWNVGKSKIFHTIFFPHPMVAKCYNKFIILTTPPFNGFIYTTRRDEGMAGILSALMFSSVISQITPSGGAMP